MNGYPKLVGLRRARVRKALTQEDLERMTGVARATISALELGKRPPRPSTVRRLAEALCVEPEELMESREVSR